MELINLKQSKTFWVNNLENADSIKECSVESLSPQYRHSSSVFLPNLNNSFLGLVFKRRILHAPNQMLILVDSNEYVRLI